jgi:hypothetical protein
MKEKIEKQIQELAKTKDEAVKERDFHYSGILSIKIDTLKGVLKML